MGFWKYAQEDPGYLAIVDPDGTEHAAGDVLARANQVVHALRALGLKQGDTVAAVLPNGSHPMHVYLAALQAGFVLRADQLPALARRRSRTSSQDADAKAFVSHERYADVVSAAADEAGIPTDEPARARHGPRLPLVRRGGRRAARRRCPTTARPARRCTTRRARPASPRA